MEQSTPQQFPTEQRVTSSEHDAMYVTVDILLLRLDKQKRNVELLLVKRRKTPDKGRYAFPGGFVNLAESLEQAAKRELAEETHVQSVFLEQLGAFGDPGRDPRYRVVTIVYFSFVQDGIEAEADDDADALGWFPLTEVNTLSLAFDHPRLFHQVIQRLRLRLATTAQAARILPKSYTLSDVRDVLEAFTRVGSGDASVEDTRSTEEEV